MKKMLKVLDCLCLLEIIVAGGLWWYSQTSTLGISLPFREE